MKFTGMIAVCSVADQPLAGGLHKDHLEIDIASPGDIGDKKWLPSYTWQPFFLTGLLRSSFLCAVQFIINCFVVLQCGQNLPVYGQRENTIPSTPGSVFSGQIADNSL